MSIKVPMREFVERIGLQYAKAELREAFNKCERTSALLQQALRGLGVEAIQIRGAIHPDTPRESWHPRWVSLAKRSDGIGSMDDGFVHYWVEANGLIVDPTIAQFGYGCALGVFEVGDPRYESFGPAERSITTPIGLKRVKGMACSSHRDYATPVTHAVNYGSHLPKVFMCSSCAEVESVSHPEARITALRDVWLYSPADAQSKTMVES